MQFVDARVHYWQGVPTLKIWNPMTHRVFLSSTFTDLIQYREAVQAAIKQLGAFDVSMENFGARDRRPTDECIRLVKEESDIFVGIYAYRYGYIPDGSDVSISEIEYRAASEAALPRFIYIVDERQSWLPAQIDAGDSGEKLRTFKEALFKRHICQTFMGADNLAAKVVADVGRHIALQKTTRVGPDVRVQNIALESMVMPEPVIPNEWSIRRDGMYDSSRNIFLTHLIHPSSKPGQHYDVYIYLIRHGSENFTDVRFAEFFMGKYWNNRIFPAVERDGFIGISTSAYGTFLCLCRVTFKDGTQVYLDRYIDFEMYRTGGN
jgi:hypothetical protein